MFQPHDKLQWNNDGRRRVEALVKQHQERFDAWGDALHDLHKMDDPVSSIFPTSRSQYRDGKDSALIAQIVTTSRASTSARTTQNIISRKQSIPEMELIINSA